MKNFKKIHSTAIVALFALLLSLNGLAAVSAQSQADILIFRQDGNSFKEAVKGLIEGLEGEFSVWEFVVTKTSDAEELSGILKETQAQLVVLLDNVVMTLYKEYQQALPDGEDVVPSICLMASFMEFSIQGIRNTVGISYEVPLVRSAVKFRTIFPNDIKNIGVVSREFMTNYVAQEQEFCAKEEIELSSFSITDTFKTTDLKKRLKKLQKSADIDVIWVPNDNRLVNAKLIRSVWIPFVKKFKKPVIVGVEVLVNPKLNFGSFAVLPDHLELGAQTAELIFEIMDNGGEIEEDGLVIPPRSIYTSINAKHARRFKISDERLEFVDNVIH